MSISLILVAVIQIAILLTLTFRLLPSGEGRLPVYRECLASLWSDGGLRAVGCWLHYLSLHLLPLVLGLAFLLRTDVNFLPVLFTILFSMQLLQRVYPGVLRLEAENELEESDGEGRE